MISALLALCCWWLFRRIGVDADVVGGETAGYSVPSAYPRGQRRLSGSRGP